MSNTGVAPLSQLDAVNLMLAAVFEAPVNTLDVAGIEDVAVAQRLLSLKVRQVLTSGQVVNSEEEVTLARDSITGKVPLPNNTLRVDATASDGANVVQRGSFLYDRTNHTFVFARDVKVNILYLLEWDDLPEHVKLPIVVCASRLFQQHVLGNADSGAYTSEEEKDAKVLLLEAETDTDDLNMFYDSCSTASILDR